MKQFTKSMLLAGAMSLASSFAFGQDNNIPDVVTLIKNIKVFDGLNDGLKDVDVLVVKNKIHKIGKNIPTPGI